MYFRAQQIRDISDRYRNPLNESRSFTQSESQTSVFLSHKHTDKFLMLRIKTMLENIGISVYIDWLDEEMTAKTSGMTAKILKQKIKDYDKFILVATNDAIDSKWCNWELGLGDAAKYDDKKISIMPITINYDSEWHGAEYLQIYPTIEYEDGTSQYTDGRLIQRGYYVLYPPQSNGNRTIVNLKDWLLR